MILQLAKLIKHIKYLKAFKTAKGIGGFAGIYESYEKAEKAAKTLGRTNYNHEAVANWYADNLANHKMELKDYPVLYWLKSIITEKGVVFDVGGNLGNHFSLFKKIDTTLNSINWIVFDLHEIVEKGKSINKDTNLSFTSNIEDLNPEHIIVANGSLQYFDDLTPFYELLKTAGNQHLIISSIPLHQDFKFVTIQNGGIAYYPSVVWKHSDFTEKMKSLGYDIIDQWKDPISDCFIPFHPKASKAKYYGFYFRKR